MSNECLVTLVIKADLGGWLGHGSLLSRVLPPVASAARSAFLEPMIMSVVVLRDKVR